MSTAMSTRVRSFRAPARFGALRASPAVRPLASTAVRARKLDADGAEASDLGLADAVADVAASVETAMAEIKRDSSVVSDAGDDVATFVHNESHELSKKVRAAAARLERGLLEREAEVRLLLLAALAGEHLLLLGPPGTAKSELARRLSNVVHGTYFERLLTRFSVPEELFGPLSMQGLENDKCVFHSGLGFPTRSSFEHRSQTSENPACSSPT